MTLRMLRFKYAFEGDVLCKIRLTIDETQYTNI